MLVMWAFVALLLVATHASQELDSLFSSFVTSPGSPAPPSPGRGFNGTSDFAHDCLDAVVSLEDLRRMDDCSSAESCSSLFTSSLANVGVPKQELAGEAPPVDAVKIATLVWQGAVLESVICRTAACRSVKKLQLAGLQLVLLRAIANAFRDLYSNPKTQQKKKILLQLIARRGCPNTSLRNGIFVLPAVTFARSLAQKVGDSVALAKEQAAFKDFIEKEDVNGPLIPSIIRLAHEAESRWIDCARNRICLYNLSTSSSLHDIKLYFDTAHKGDSNFSPVELQKIVSYTHPLRVQLAMYFSPEERSEFFIPGLVFSSISVAMCLALGVLVLVWKILKFENNAVWFMTFACIFLAALFRLFYWSLAAHNGITLPLAPKSVTIVVFENLANLVVPLAFVSAVLIFFYVWLAELFRELASKDWSRAFTILKWTLVSLGLAILIVALTLGGIYMNSQRDLFGANPNDPAYQHVIYFLWVLAMLPVPPSLGLCFVAVYAFFILRQKGDSQTMRAITKMIILFMILFLALATRGALVLANTVTYSGIPYPLVFIVERALCEIISIAVICYFLLVSLSKAHYKREKNYAPDSELNTQREREYLIENRYDY